MEQKFVLLTTAANSFQKSIIEAILRSAGISYLSWNPSLTVVLGSERPLSLEQFQVPADQLQIAKEILCAHGVVCEVSGRLLNRALEEIIKPLLGTSERDLSRLQRFVEVNNKETVRALCEATLREEGGGE